MESITLEAEKRGTGRHEIRELRATERVPAVMYGAGAAPQAIVVDARSLHKALVAAGSGLIGIKVGKSAVVQVLTRQIQRDPVKRNIIHVDFQAVSLTEKLRLHVPVQPTGVAPISNTSDLVLVRVTDSIEIECLPMDIPSHISADITKLQTVDDEVLARDLELPANVRLVTDPEHVIYAVTVARSAAEEEAEAAEAASAEDVEVIAKGKAAKGEEEPAA